jgi:hypothetical protein
MKTIRALTLMAFAALLAGCEPAFVQTCSAECSCTGDEFACREPRSGGCDNQYRRDWTIASQKGCEAEFLSWFDCFSARAVCTTNAGTKTYEPPAGACDAQYSRYNSCG